LFGSVHNGMPACARPGKFERLEKKHVPLSILVKLPIVPSSGSIYCLPERRVTIRSGRLGNMVVAFAVSAKCLRGSVPGGERL
jgi:hypothetical protein